jgi:hypothetical protein
MNEPTLIFAILTVAVLLRYAWYAMTADQVVTRKAAEVVAGMNRPPLPRHSAPAGETRVAAMSGSPASHYALSRGEAGHPLLVELVPSTLPTPSKRGGMQPLTALLERGKSERLQKRRRKTPSPLTGVGEDVVWAAGYSRILCCH